MTHTHAKGQGHRSLGFKDTVEWKQTDGQTDGRTDGVDYTTCLANAVGNKCCYQLLVDVKIKHQVDRSYACNSVSWLWCVSGSMQPRVHQDEDSGPLLDRPDGERARSETPDTQQCEIETRPSAARRLAATSGSQGNVRITVYSLSHHSAALQHTVLIAGCS